MDRILAKKPWYLKPKIYVYLIGLLILSLLYVLVINDILAHYKQNLGFVNLKLPFRTTLG
jgi:hypothetical protein